MITPYQNRPYQDGRADATAVLIASRRNWRPLAWLGAALLLLALQILSGTGPLYAVLVFTLLFVSYFAVRWAGGLDSLFGLCIAYLLLQHVLICQIAKVFYWESADAPLHQPLITMGVYVVGMASLAVGALLARRITRRRKHPLLMSETEPRRLLWTTFVCSLLAATQLVLWHTLRIDADTGNIQQGGVLGPFEQIACFGPLAVACGTVYYLKSSNNKRSFGWANGLPMLILTLFALIDAGRAAMAFPIVAYFTTCIAYRFRFRFQHYAIVALGAYVASFIFFPYALAARRITRTPHLEENIRLTSDLLLDIVANPLKYHELQSLADKKAARQSFTYYDHPSATLGRYTILVISDGVVDATVNSGATGFDTIGPGVESLLPRFLYPDKPVVNTGNYLAHREPGLLPNRRDVTTGITLGFFADAFSSFGWFGIAFIPCLLMLCLEVIYIFLLGNYVWGNTLVLSIVLQVTWGFSEQTISPLLIMIFQASLAIAFGLFFVRILVNVLEKVADRTKSTRLLTTTKGYRHTAPLSKRINAG